jgi:hypothetical protein
MVRARPRKRKKSQRRTTRRKSEYYTPVELFLAALGLIILIGVIGAVVAAVLD